MVFQSFSVRPSLLPLNVTMNSVVTRWGQYTRDHRVSKREQTRRGPYEAAQQSAQDLTARGYLWGILVQTGKDKGGSPGPLTNQSPAQMGSPQCRVSPRCFG